MGGMVLWYYGIGTVTADPRNIRHTATPAGLCHVSQGSYYIHENSKLNDIILRGQTEHILPHSIKFIGKCIVSVLIN